MQSLPRNDFIRKSARWEPYHCFRRNIMGSSEAVSHCKPSQHRRPRSDQRKRRSPLFCRELVARLRPLSVSAQRHFSGCRHNSPEFSRQPFSGADGVRLRRLAQQNRRETFNQGDLPRAYRPSYKETQLRSISPVALPQTGRNGCQLPLLTKSGEPLLSKQIQ